VAPSPGKHYQAHILERRDVSPDLWIIRIDPGGPFEFRAGQFATLGFENEGKRVERAYSIVSSPYEKFLEFFVELVPHGNLTPGLHRLGKGDALLCRKIAKGRFTLDLRSGRTNHLLVSTVTGIAPFVSFVRTLYRDWKNADSVMPGNHKLFCLHGASRSLEFGYREELERFSNEVLWFKYIPTVSRPWEDSHWKGETGRADDLLRKYADAWGLQPDATTCYLCGHPRMVENARGILLRAGWKNEAVFEEVYFQPATGEAAGSG
jgi:ferredoxin/flavodoxin---NADP+ reductase